MIVRLKHTDGRLMAFECVAFNVQPDGTAVSFVSPTGKELEWEGSQMDVIEEMTIHYDSGILMQKVVGAKQFHGAQGSFAGDQHTASEVSQLDTEHQRHEDIVKDHGYATGRSTAGMGG